MFLDMTGSMHPEAPDPSCSGCSIGPDDHLAAMVRAAFPALTMGGWRIDQSGGDHVLLIVDGDIVFRFPRVGTHDLNLEIAVLLALKPTMPVATPAYDYIDPQGRFAGYRYLRGAALTPQRFAALSSARQDELAKSAAQFLSILHGLPSGEIAPEKCWPKIWTARQFGKRARNDRLPVLANLLPGTIDAIGRFYAEYMCDRPPGMVVVHGDLVAEHILLDRSGRLCGIIDFGDVALGDPAQDFLGFWAYGEATTRRVVDLYEPGTTDPGLLARSRNHFIRYRLDQLYENVDNAGFDLPRAAAEIEALIAI